MVNNATELARLITPSRQITGKVRLYSTLNEKIFTDYLSTGLAKISIEVSSDQGKFFGFGVCQKATIELLDANRTIDIPSQTHFSVNFSANGGTSYTASQLPRFYITESSRDENTNNVTFVGYDKIYNSSLNTFSELNMAAPYTILDVATSVASFLGLTLSYPSEITAFATSYSEGANLEGTETLRSILDDIAEATQTIYYVKSNQYLVFKKLTASPVITIGKSDYFTLTSESSRILTTIVSATELGDNVSSTTGATGETQYVRNNPFWELRTDVATLLDNAVANIGGLTIVPYNCAWRGNYLLEIGDCISITTKDGNTINSFYLNDTLEYSGGLNSTISWEYPTNTTETESNPSTIGEALNKTYARVDKVNSQIDMVVSKVDGYDSKISQITLDQDSINASVSSMSNSISNVTSDMSSLSNRQDATDGNINTLTQKVDASITSTQVELQIKKELSNGVDKVTTSTGFTFNQDGLTVSKSNVDITTNITEDGMTVSKNNQVVLTANNEGVEALNLHATTYLIIGENSRFEDYDNGSRTGCFWIG